MLETDPSAWRWIALMSLITVEVSAGSKPSPIYLSQDKLGQLANLSRNSIGPILRRFAARGCIKIRYGAITVSNVRALSQVIAG